jgi:hypothetical protein
MMKPARKKPFERKVAARVNKRVALSHWLRAEASMPAGNESLRTASWTGRTAVREVGKKGFCIGRPVEGGGAGGDEGEEGGEAGEVFSAEVVERELVEGQRGVVGEGGVAEEEEEGAEAAVEQADGGQKRILVLPAVVVARDGAEVEGVPADKRVGGGCGGVEGGAENGEDGEGEGEVEGAGDEEHGTDHDVPRRVRAPAAHHCPLQPRPSPRRRRPPRPPRGLGGRLVRVLSRSCRLVASLSCCARPLPLRPPSPRRPCPRLRQPPALSPRHGGRSPVLPRRPHRPPRPPPRQPSPGLCTLPRSRDPLHSLALPHLPCLSSRPRRSHRLRAPHIQRTLGPRPLLRPLAQRSLPPALLSSSRCTHWSAPTKILCILPRCCLILSPTCIFPPFPLHRLREPALVDGPRLDRRPPPWRTSVVVLASPPPRLPS